MTDRRKRIFKLIQLKLKYPGERRGRQVAIKITNIGTEKLLNVSLLSLCFVSPSG